MRDPERARCPRAVDGGVSTAPLSYKPWMADAGRGRTWATITRQRRARRRSARAPATRQRRAHPPRHRAGAGLLAREHRRVGRVLRAVAVPAGAPTLAAAARDRRAQATRHLQDHIRLCFDCCHFAVEYEDPGRRARALQRRGIRIGRVQLSSALRVRFPRPNAAAMPWRRALQPFADTTYLHQVVERQRRRSAPLSRSRRRAATGQAARRRRRVAHSLSRAALHTASTRRSARRRTYVRQDVLALRRRRVHAPPRDRDLHLGRAAAGAENRPARIRSRASTSGCSARSIGSAPARRRSDAMHRTAVLNVVGLTPAILSGRRCAASVAAGPRAAGVAQINAGVPRGDLHGAEPTTSPAVYPDEHGIVGNGWYFRDECEIQFWRQSNKLVQAPKIWDTARAADPTFTCANLFWWFNMYSTADYTVTPRPMYPADGRKLPDIYTTPGDPARRAAGRARHVPAVRVLGPEGVDRLDAWIADVGEARRPAVHADADARLPAAPRLQPAARRPERSRCSRRHPAGSTRSAAI